MNWIYRGRLMAELVHAAENDHSDWPPKWSLTKRACEQAHLVFYSREDFLTGEDHCNLFKIPQTYQQFIICSVYHLLTLRENAFN